MLARHRGAAVAAAAAGLAALGIGGATAQALSLPPGWNSIERPGVTRVPLPAGATQVQLSATGGSGGGTLGGRGAAVSGTVPVNGARYMMVRVGSHGGFAVDGTPSPGTIYPGEGGVASFVGLCVEERCEVIRSLVIVAAGGGGSSAGGMLFDVAAGGDACAAGASGLGGIAAGGGGAPGGQFGGAGGAGGQVPGICSGSAGPTGESGTWLFGGDGGGYGPTPIDVTRLGGDGGEGRFGGGGGGAAATCDDEQDGGAGGGGGGSNLVPPGGSQGLNDASVVSPGVRWFVEIDAVAPTITIAAPLDGATYTEGAPVRADYACSDEAGGAGLASCSGPVASGALLDTAAAGVQQFTVSARDAAGNSATRTITYTVEPPSARPPILIAVRGLRASARSLRFTLSTAASVTVTFERRKHGRRARWATVGTLRRDGRAGVNTIRLGGRVGRRRLTPGSYRVTVTPAGDVKPSSATFVVRASRRARSGRRAKTRR